jgi:hypothetical protein
MIRLVALSLAFIALIVCAPSTYAQTIHLMSDGSVIEGPVPEVHAHARMRSAHVIASAPNAVRHASEATPTADPAWNYPWWLASQQRVRAVDSWSLLGRGEGAVVAVIDTGVSLSNMDIAPQLVPGWDFVEGDDQPDDPNGHGTHVAGTIAAIADNQLSTFGVAPAAKIMPLRVLGKNGSGSDANIARAINWAVEHGADAINLSLGGADPSTVLTAAIARARNQGVAVACAAGNTPGGLEWPAAAPACVPVRALDQSGTAAASWSAGGVSADGQLHGVAAPGINVWSLTPDGSVIPMDGTSMATPHVAAALAQLVSKGRTPSQAQQLVEQSARDIDKRGPDDATGYGVLDLYRLGLVATGQSLPGCRAERIALAPGSTDYTFDMTSLCHGMQLHVLRTFPSRTIAIVSGNQLVISFAAGREWAMNRVAVELADETDPEHVAVTLTFATAEQPTSLRIGGRPCGLSAARACTVKANLNERGVLAFEGRWTGRVGRQWPLRLRMIRLADEASDTARTRTTGNRFWTRRPSADFYPGMYKITPMRASLAGRTFYLRVT